MNKIYIIFIILFCITSVKADSPPSKKIMHIVIKNTNPDDIKILIPKISKNGFNTLVLGIYNGVRLKSMKNNEKIRTWDKKELLSVVKLARDNNLEVIPEIKLLTHQEHFLKRAYPQFMYNPATYNPENNKLYSDVIFPYLEEIKDLLNPSAILIGHDEVAGHNDKSRKKFLKNNQKVLPAELFLIDVIKIHEFLSIRDIETWMWGDMLISKSEFPSMLSRHLHGSYPGYGKSLRKQLPKDIVICDWHYFDKQKDFPTLSTMQQEGFRVIGATWTEKETIENFNHYAKKNNAYGMMATTWYHIQRKNWRKVDEIIKLSGEIFNNTHSEN